MLSLHTGYDVRYLTDAVGGGTRYSTGAAGEPPGTWGGRGAVSLGLSGDVDGAVMARLYHEDTAPDGERLSTRQRKAEYATLAERVEAAVQKIIAARGGFARPEDEREIRLRERAKSRNSVPFYDFTFSMPKSVSVLWASLRAAAKLAEEESREADAVALAERARAIEGAVRRANERLMDVAERRAAYVRTGHHSANTGEYRDADGFVVASFLQHTSRSGDPQLHVHNAILNRAQRADKGDGKWRALHGAALWAQRLGLSADGEAFEVGGITDTQMAAFSDRSAETAARARELTAEYQAAHGRAPDARADFLIRKRAALETRDSKDHAPPDGDQELPAWAPNGAKPGSWPRFTRARTVTARSTRRAACPITRSGPGRSGSLWPRCSVSTRRGPAAIFSASFTGPCRTCQPRQTRRPTWTSWPMRCCPAARRA
jgi:hypothetical protein